MEIKTEELVIVVNGNLSLTTTISFIKTFCKGLNLNLQKTIKGLYTIEADKDLYIEIKNRMQVSKECPRWIVTSSDEDGICVCSCLTFKEALKQHNKLEKSGHNAKIHFGYI